MLISLQGARSEESASAENSPNPISNPNSQGTLKAHKWSHLGDTRAKSANCNTIIVRSDDRARCFSDQMRCDALIQSSRGKTAT
jgi:hypothetical protein